MFCLSRIQYFPGGPFFCLVIILPLLPPCWEIAVAIFLSPIQLSLSASRSCCTLKLPVFLIWWLTGVIWRLYSLDHSGLDSLPVKYSYKSVALNLDHLDHIQVFSLGTMGHPLLSEDRDVLGSHIICPVTAKNIPVVQKRRMSHSYMSETERSAPQVDRSVQCQIQPLGHSLCGTKSNMTLTKMQYWTVGFGWK